jgi:hypothetical protein
MLALCLTAGAFAAFVGLGYEWSLLRTVYPAFLMTKDDDFDAIHRLEERGIGEIVPIALLNIAATPVLYWIAPASQRIWVELALLGLIVSFAWGFAVQIPAHLRLNKEPQSGQCSPRPGKPHPNSPLPDSPSSSPAYCSSASRPHKASARMTRMI